MGKKSTSGRGQKKHAKALKRRARLAARPTQSTFRTLGSPGVGRAPLLSLARVWNPAVPWRGEPPPPLRVASGPGPDWLAVAYREGWVALYRRSEDGSTELPPLPVPAVDQRVAWATRPVPLLPPSRWDVSWVREPALVGDAVRGAIAVHALVQDVEGLVWAPIVEVTVQRREDVGVLDAQILGGVLRPEGFEATWGAHEPHEHAVHGFVLQYEDALWRLLAGGPGIDSACRVRALRGNSHTYRRWAVDAVVHHAAEDVPALLELLRSVADGSGDPDDEGPLLALVVLAHLGVVEAHAPLLTLARLPDEGFAAQFGDFVTEGLNAALVRTSGGELAGIRALLLDPGVDDWVRGAALDAWSGAVALGMAPRAELLDLLVGLLAAPEGVSEPGSPVWSAVAGALMDLEAVEVEERLLDACDSGLLGRGDLGPDDVRLGLRGAGTGPDCLRILRSGDVHQWVGRWSE